MIKLLLGLVLIIRVVDGCLSDSELLSNIITSAGNIGEQPVPNKEGSQEDETSKVLNIQVGLDVNYFNIVPHTSSLEIDGTIIKEWKHPSLYFSHLKPCHTSISLTHLKHKLWVPELSFVNAANIVLHSHSVRIRLHEDGTITHSERMKQSVPCKTQASTYPFGNTTCTLLWRNDDITRDTAKIQWKMIKSEGQEV